MAPPAQPVVGYLLLRQEPVEMVKERSASHQNDAAEHTALLDALSEHSPTIEPNLPNGCWLDLRAGKRVPALDTRGEALLATAQAWDYPTARIGIAPTPGVARLAALHGTGNVTILIDPHAIGTFLTPIAPIATGLDPVEADRLALLGLRTLGAIAALPRGTLGDHLGPTGPALEALARGEDDRPLVPARPPLVLTARRDLDWAIDDRASLAHLIETLLAPLLAHLEHRGLGATRATLVLGQEGKRPVARTVVLTAPTTARDRIHTALVALLPVPEMAPAAHEADAEPQGGFTHIGVALSAPRPLIGRQASFFDLPTGRAALLQHGLSEARRRSDAPLGYLHLVNPQHPYPEQRYALAAIPERDAENSAAVSAALTSERP